MASGRRSSSNRWARRFLYSGAVLHFPHEGSGHCDRGRQRKALGRILRRVITGGRISKKHPDYESNAKRIRNRVALQEVLAEVFMTRSTRWRSGWSGFSRREFRVRSCVTFRKFAHRIRNAHVRQMFPVMDHPTAGLHRVTGTPVKLSETPEGIRLLRHRYSESTRKRTC